MICKFKKICSTLALSLFIICAWAQDKKIDVDINMHRGMDKQWYAQPWLWIVGGAVFILLLVALMRSGRGKKD